MPEASFVDRILSKIDKIDQASLRKHFLDLAKEKESLCDILEALSEGLLVIDLAGRILFANQSAKSLLGISQSVPLTGKSLNEIVRDKELRDFLAFHITSQNYVLHQEIEILTPHHSFLSISLAPYHNRSGIRQGNILLLSNTTLPREKEREQSRLEKTESLISLARGVAHEIGNPLNAITIHLKLLGDEIANLPPANRESAEELLRIIAAETQRLASMVRNFLTATRRKPSYFKSEDINEIIREAVKVLNPEIKRANINTALHLEKDIPPMLLDGEKMHQVFINLLKNAIESMPSGGKIEIASSKTDKICSVRIADHGHGITAEDLPHIFDAYYTTKEEGSGLGLMIVHDIVKDHGGRIEIHSKPAAGTTVTLYLPIRHEKISLPENLKVSAQP